MRRLLYNAAFLSTFSDTLAWFPRDKRTVQRLGSIRGGASADGWSNTPASSGVESDDFDEAKGIMENEKNLSFLNDSSDEGIPRQEEQIYTCSTEETPNDFSSDFNITDEGANMEETSEELMAAEEVLGFIDQDTEEEQREEQRYSSVLVEETETGNDFSTDLDITGVEESVNLNSLGTDNTNRVDDMNEIIESDLDDDDQVVFREEDATTSTSFDTFEFDESVLRAEEEMYSEKDIELDISDEFSSADPDNESLVGQTIEDGYEEFKSDEDEDEDEDEGAIEENDTAVADFDQVGIVDFVHSSEGDNEDKQMHSEVDEVEDDGTGNPVLISLTQEDEEAIQAQEEAFNLHSLGTDNTNRVDDMNEIIESDLDDDDQVVFREEDATTSTSFDTFEFDESVLRAEEEMYSEKDIELDISDEFSSADPDNESLVGQTIEDGYEEFKSDEDEDEDEDEGAIEENDTAVADFDQVGIVDFVHSSEGDNEDKQMHSEVDEVEDDGTGNPVLISLTQEDEEAIQAQEEAFPDVHTDFNDETNSDAAREEIQKTEDLESSNDASDVYPITGCHDDGDIDSSTPDAIDLEDQEAIRAQEEAFPDVHTDFTVGDNFEIDLIDEVQQSGDHDPNYPLCDVYIPSLHDDDIHRNAPDAVDPVYGEISVRTSNNFEGENDEDPYVDDNPVNSDEDLYTDAKPVDISDAYDSHDDHSTRIFDGIDNDFHKEVDDTQFDSYAHLTMDISENAQFQNEHDQVKGRNVEIAPPESPVPLDMVLDKYQKDILGPENFVVEKNAESQNDSEHLTIAHEEEISVSKEDIDFSDTTTEISISDDDTIFDTDIHRQSDDFDAEFDVNDGMDMTDFDPTGSDSAAFVDRMDLADAYDHDRDTEGSDSGIIPITESMAKPGNIISDETEDPEAPKNSSDTVPQDEKNGIDDVMNEVLCGELGYPSAEVQSMKPDVASVLVRKMFKRPKNGLSSDYFVDGVIPTEADKNNSAVGSRPNTQNRRRRFPSLQAFRKYDSQDKHQTLHRLGYSSPDIQGMKPGIAEVIVKRSFKRPKNAPEFFVGGFIPSDEKRIFGMCVKNVCLSALVLILVPILSMLRQDESHDAFSTANDFKESRRSPIVPETSTISTTHNEFDVSVPSR